MLLMLCGALATYIVSIIIQLSNQDIQCYSIIVAVYLLLFKYELNNIVLVQLKNHTISVMQTSKLSLVCRLCIKTTDGHTKVTNTAFYDLTVDMIMTPLFLASMKLLLGTKKQ